MWAEIAQLVQRLVTGWAVRRSNPGGRVRFSAHFQTDPGSHPASYTIDTASLPVVKRPGRGVTPPHIHTHTIHRSQRKSRGKSLSPPWFHGMSYSELYLIRPRRDKFEDPAVLGTMIFKWILNKQGDTVRTGLIWLRLRTSRGFL